MKRIFTLVLAFVCVSYSISSHGTVDPWYAVKVDDNRRLNEADVPVDDVTLITDQKLGEGLEKLSGCLAVTPTDPPRFVDRTEFCQKIRQDLVHIL